MVDTTIVYNFQLNMMSKSVYIITGEPSGDLLASRLMKSLWKQDSDISFSGMGGETMAELGFKSLFDISEISVMGAAEVIPRLPLILKRLNQVVEDIKQKQPDVVVTVDSWGFVSQVLSRLKKQGVTIPRVNYVAPQVWAWKKGRAKKAAQLIDRLMTLLPYEPPYFEKYGLQCDFVGHPVIENILESEISEIVFRTEYGIPEDSTLLCVLPGSRHSEISKLAPVFCEVVKRLVLRFPNLFIVIPSVEARVEEIKQVFASLPVPYRIVVGQSERYNAFKISQFALAASGTVSLELTACGTPHVIAYTFKYITNKIIKHLATTKYANLINILADKFIIPEFVLENCRADLITPKVIELMSNNEKSAAQVAEAQEYLKKLSPENDILPSEKAASVVLEMIKK